MTESKVYLLQVNIPYEVPEIKGVFSTCTKAMEEVIKDPLLSEGFYPFRMREIGPDRQKYWLANGKDSKDTLVIVELPLDQLC